MALNGSSFSYTALNECNREKGDIKLFNIQKVDDSIAGLVVIYAG